MSGISRVNRNVWRVGARRVSCRRPGEIEGIRMGRGRLLRGLRAERLSRDVPAHRFGEDYTGREATLDGRGATFAAMKIERAPLDDQAPAAA